MPLELTLEKFENVVGYDGKVFYVLHQYPGTGCPQYPYGALYQDTSGDESNQIKFRRLKPTPTECFGKEHKYKWPRDPRLQCFAPGDVIEDAVVGASPPDGACREKAATCNVPSNLMPVVQSVSSVSLETCQKLIGTNETSVPSTSAGHPKPSIKRSISKAASGSQISVPAQPCTANKSKKLLDSTLPKICETSNGNSAQLSKVVERAVCDKNSTSTSVHPPHPSITILKEVLPSGIISEKITEDGSISNDELPQVQTTTHVPVLAPASSQSDSPKTSCATSATSANRRNSIENRAEQFCETSMNNKNQSETSEAFSYSSNVVTKKPSGFSRTEKRNNSETGAKVKSDEPVNRNSLENVKSIIIQKSSSALKTNTNQFCGVPKRRSSTIESSSSTSNIRSSSSLKDINALKAILCDDSPCNYRDLKNTGSAVDSTKDKSNAPEVQRCTKISQKRGSIIARRRSGVKSLDNTNLKLLTGIHAQSYEAAEKEFDEYVDFLLETAMESKSSSSHSSVEEEDHNNSGCLSSSKDKVLSIARPEDTSDGNAGTMDENITKECLPVRKELEVENEGSASLRPRKVEERSRISSPLIGTGKHKLPQMVVQRPSNLKEAKYDKDIVSPLVSISTTRKQILGELLKKDILNSLLVSKDETIEKPHTSHNKISSSHRRSSNGDHSYRRRSRSPEKRTKPERRSSVKSFSNRKAFSKSEITFIDLTLDSNEDPAQPNHKRNMGEPSEEKDSNKRVKDETALQDESTSGSIFSHPSSGVSQNSSVQSPTTEEKLKRELNSKKDNHASVVEEGNCISRRSPNNLVADLPSGSSQSNSDAPHCSSTPSNLNKTSDLLNSSKFNQKCFTNIKSKTPLKRALVAENTEVVIKSSKLELRYNNLTKEQTESNSSRENERIIDEENHTNDQSCHVIAEETHQYPTPLHRHSPNRSSTPKLSEQEEATAIFDSVVVPFKRAIKMKENSIVNLNTSNLKTVEQTPIPTPSITKPANVDSPGKEIVAPTSEGEIHDQSIQIHFSLPSREDISTVVMPEKTPNSCEKEEGSEEISQCSQQGETKRIRVRKTRRKIASKRLSELPPSLMSLYMNRKIRVNRLLLNLKYTAERLSTNSKLLRGQRLTKRNNLPEVQKALPKTDDIPNPSKSAKQAATAGTLVLDSKPNGAPKTSDDSKQAAVTGSLMAEINVKKVTQKPTHANTATDGCFNIRSHQHSSKTSLEDSIPAALNEVLMVATRMEKLPTASEGSQLAEISVASIADVQVENTCTISHCSKPAESTNRMVVDSTPVRGNCKQSLMSISPVDVKITDLNKLSEDFKQEADTLTMEMKTENSPETLLDTKINILHEGLTQPEMKGSFITLMDVSKQSIEVKFEDSKPVIFDNSSLAINFEDSVKIESGDSSQPEIICDNSRQVETPNIPTVDTKVPALTDFSRPEPLPSYSNKIEAFPRKQSSSPRSNSRTIPPRSGLSRAPAHSENMTTNHFGSPSLPENLININTGKVLVNTKRARRRRRCKKKKREGEGIDPLLPNIEIAKVITRVDYGNTISLMAAIGNRQAPTCRGRWQARGGHRGLERGSKTHYGLNRRDQDGTLNRKSIQQATTIRKNETTQMGTTWGKKESTQKVIMSVEDERIMSQDQDRTTITANKTLTIGDEGRGQLTKSITLPGQSMSDAIRPNQLLEGSTQMTRRARRRARRRRNYGNAEPASDGHSAHCHRDFQRGRNTGPSRGNQMRQSNDNATTLSGVNRLLRSTSHRSRSGLVRRILDENPN